MATLFSIAPTSAEIVLKDNEGVDQPVRIKLQGSHIPAVKSKSLEAIAWLQGAGKTDKPDEMVKAILKAESVAVELAACAIIGWDNDEYMGGTYTPEYALELMKKPELSFVREQINTFVTDKNNFFRKGTDVATSGTTPTVSPRSTNKRSK